MENAVVPMVLQDDEIKPFHQESLLHQFVFLKSHGRPYSEAGQMFLTILSNSYQYSPMLQTEIQNFADALLEKPTMDVTYLQILAMLSDQDLHHFVTCLIRFYEKPHQIEERCALLFSLIKLYPKCIDEYPVLELLMETSNMLLTEGKRKFTVYCNKYRAVFALECFPLLMSSNKTDDLIPFYVRELREVVRFHVGTVLNTCPDEATVISHPDAAWYSLYRLVGKVCQLSKISFGELWDRKNPTLHGLTSWWRSFLIWMNDEESDKKSNLESDVLIMFWAFLIEWYSDLKSDIMVAERRPFLVRITLDEEMQETSPRRPALNSLTSTRPSNHLQDTLQLTREVWNCMNLPARGSFLENTIKALYLEASTIYVTFRYDLAVLEHVPLSIDSLPETHPSWLKLQIVLQKASFLSYGDLTVPVFEELLRVCLQLRLNNPPRPDQLESLRNRSSRFVYMWNDHEIFAFCCNIFVGYFESHSLERASEEFLSYLLVVIQPVAELHLDLLRQLLAFIEIRKKFTFKQFFEYVVLPEIIAEFAGLVGKVNMELRTEPFVAGVTVHKTRGANRESTEALQTELLRHTLVSGMNTNPFRAVQNFLKNEKDVLIKFVLNNAKPPLKLSSKVS